MFIDTSSYYRPPTTMISSGLIGVGAGAGACLLIRKLFQQRVWQQPINQDSFRFILGATLLGIYATRCLVSSVLAAVELFKLSSPEEELLLASISHRLDEVNNTRIVHAGKLSQIVLKLSDQMLARHTLPVASKETVEHQQSAIRPPPILPTIDTNRVLEGLEKLQELQGKFHALGLNPRVIEETEIWIDMPKATLRLKDIAPESVEELWYHTEKMHQHRNYPATIYCPLSVRPDPLPKHFLETDDWEVFRLVVGPWMKELEDPSEALAGNYPQIILPDLCTSYNINAQFFREIEYEPIEPLPEPPSDISLDWLLEEFDRIEGFKNDLEARANLIKYITVVSSEEGAAYLPNKKKEVYVAMHVKALLCVAIIKKLPLEEREPLIKEIAGYGALCGIGSADATDELYERLTGKVPSAPGSVEEIFAKACEISLRVGIEKVLLDPGLKDETVVIRDFLVHCLKKQCIKIPPSLFHGESPLALDMGLYAYRNCEPDPETNAFLRIFLKIAVEFPAILHRLLNEQLLVDPGLADRIWEIIKAWAETHCSDPDAEKLKSIKTKLNLQRQELAQALTKEKLERHEALKSLNPVAEFLRAQCYCRLLKSFLDTLSDDCKKEIAIVSSLIKRQKWTMDNLEKHELCKEWITLNYFIEHQNKCYKDLEKSQSKTIDDCRFKLASHFNDLCSFFLWTGKGLNKPLITLQGIFAVAEQIGVILAPRASP